MAVANKPFKIGKYEVIERLGGGGMGDVYKAVDPRIGRTVAIKVIKGDFDQDPELLRRFDIEARAVGNLEHPNIVAVFEFGEENGIPYLVMPYLDGISLDKVIAQRQNLEVIQKLDIIIGVLKALDYAHEHRVIHRDVKPANVHLLKDGSVKLLDFGIAREGDVSLTKTKQVMGTLSYMPPEQMNMEVVDRRGDIFSTGIILFELLTYSLPFEARDQASIIVQRLKGDPPPPLSKYFDNYPLELDDIISRALMRDREERYSRAEDFAFDLTRVQERLKREKASHCVDQARALIAKSDLLKARDLLSEVIRIDTQNSTAKQLYYEVQQLLQAQQRVERVQRLRTQAEDALAAKQLQNAADLVEQAIKIDKNDLSLLDLREQIQEARARSEQVLMLLQRASDAQQSEQFEMAQKFVADALVLDPSDTGAKFMQATIARQLVEQEKRNRIQQLLQVARREISARQYEAARENITKAKAIDPAHPEIPGLEKMVVAGQQQERRNAELQQVCAEIERRLLDNNLAAARELAGNSLRKFPLEERLIRLKIAADEAYEQEERRIYIEQQIVLASRLVDDGQPSSALKLLQEAERLYPENTRLLEYMKAVREAAAQETAEHERKGILIRAGAAIRRKSLDEAIGTLEQGLVRFPADAEIRELLETVRRDAERLNQKRQVKEVTKRAQDLLASREHTDAIRLLEQTSAQIPDPELLRFLEYAREQAADYRSGLKDTSQEASELLNSGKHSEALAFLEKRVATYSNSAEFQELLAQAGTRVRELEPTRQRMLSTVNDARAALEAGDSLRAEAILKPTVAEFPAAPEVQALAAEISRVRQAFEHQREEAQKQALVPPSAQETKKFPSGVSETPATSIFSPEVESVAPASATPPSADRPLRSVATDVFSAQSGSGVQEPRTPMDRDNLRCSVSYPERVGPTRTAKIVASLHFETGDVARREVIVNEVLNEAKKLLDLPPGQLVKSVSKASTIPVSRESAVEITIDVPGLEFEITQKAVHLWEDRQHVEFRFTPAVDAIGTVRHGSVHFWLHGIILAHLSVRIYVSDEDTHGASAEVPRQLHAKAYRRVFPSYSHKDAVVVDQMEEYARCFGDTYLRDVSILRSGESWEERIRDYIRDADVFQLFWSENSAGSKFVQSEWREALHERQARPDPHFLRPVYWSDEPVAIPEELRRLHFTRVPLTGLTVGKSAIKSRGEAHATSIFSPDVESVAAPPVVDPGADTAVPSPATDVFAPATPSEAQQPPPARESTPVEIESPKVIRKEKQPEKKAKTVEADEAESAVVAPSPVLPPPIVEPPATAVPKPQLSKKFIFIAVAALVLVVAVAVVSWLITRPKESYLDFTVTADQQAVSGAEVSVDGKSVGASAPDGTVQAKVSPGNHKVQVTAKGFSTWSDAVRINQGERKPIEVKLQMPEAPKQVPVQGTLVVQSSDTAAEMFIDEQPRGVIGRDRKLIVKLAPGQHRVQLKKSGYQDSPENTVDIAANKSSNLSFRPLVVIPGKTAIVIDSSPRGALVRIDHKPAGTTANGPLKTKVDAGLHPVEVSKDGYDTWTRDVTVEKDQELPVTAKLSMAALPSISSFSASPSLIKKGDRTQLAWVTQNATEITIDNGLGVVQSPTGTREVQPIETTTYLLTAKGRGGTSTSQVTVNVAVPSQPTIQFAPLDAVILKKGKTTLKWSVENASEVSIDQGIGKVPVRGERDVNPEDTTTYTLTAEGPGGTKKAMAIVTVNVPSAPVIVFKPTDSSIQKGQSTKLQWTVQNANEVSIDQGIGKVMANGERDVSPRETKIYTLTASWPGGEKRQSIAITVNPRPPGVEDKPTITSLLRQFNDAVKDHNGKAIREHWPTIPKPVYDAYTSKLAQQVLEDNCPGDPTFGQDSAEWTCNETLTPVVDGKAQKALNQSYVFKFRRSGETWQIVSKTLVK